MEGETWVEPLAEALRPVDMTPTIGALALALAKAQGAMRHASFDRENPFFKMRYATLSSIWDSIRGPLSTNELAVIQDPITENGKVGVMTMLIHSSGEWKRSRLLLKPVKDDPQGVGSALTYARRYALAAMVGAVGDEDDDGNAASSGKATATLPVGAKAQAAPAPTKPAQRPQEGQGVQARAEGGQHPVKPAAESPPSEPEEDPEDWKRGVAEIKILWQRAVELGEKEEKLNKALINKFGVQDVGRLGPADRGELKGLLEKLVEESEPF